MRNKYGLIILILIILLLLGGGFLFVAKDNVANFFDSQENLASLSAPVETSSSINTIDDSVIKSEKFKSLKNNVSDFDFTSICKRKNNSSVTVIKTEIIVSLDNTAATTTPPADISCRQGNNNPFIIKTK